MMAVIDLSNKQSNGNLKSNIHQHFKLKFRAQGCKQLMGHGDMLPMKWTYNRQGFGSGSGCIMLGRRQHISCSIRYNLQHFWNTYEPNSTKKYNLQLNDSQKN